MEYMRWNLVVAQYFYSSFVDFLLQICHILCQGYVKKFKAFLHLDILQEFEKKSNTIHWVGGWQRGGIVEK